MLTLFFANKKTDEPANIYYAALAELLIDVPVLIWLWSVLPLGAWAIIVTCIFGCWVLVNVGK